MKNFFITTCLFITSFSFAQEYSRAKIFTNSVGLQHLAELGIAVDHGTVKRDTYFISDFSAVEIQQAKDAGYEVEILIADVQHYYKDRNTTPTEPKRNADCPDQHENPFYVLPDVPANFNIGSMGGFYTYQEFIDEIDAMAAQYPNLITVKDTISAFQSIEGRPIYYLRMSDNPNADEPEPEVLYTAVHHAREPNSLSEVIFYMWYLLENYTTNDEIAFLLDNTELYFVPMINPDGYIYNEVQNPNGGGLWRKNRRPNGDGTFGVDLNRNYSYGWGTTGTSSNTSNETYCGTAPFSEPETQAIKWFCENHDFLFAFNAHTYSDDILHPIGVTAAEFAEDHDYFQAFTHHMVEYNNYSNIKSSDLYPASGDSDDYMYKMDTVIKPKIFAMTPEVGSNSDGFWPAASAITGICQEMFLPNLLLAHLAHKYTVVLDSDPPTIGTTSGNFNHTAYRLGQENGPVAVSITPLQGIQTVGTPVTHTTVIMATEPGSIAYVLNTGIQFGDPVVYVLNTEYGAWTKRDTIYKTFGSATPQFLDDASTVVNWTGNWSTSSSVYVSPSRSFTESPTGNYQNSTTRTFTLNQPIDLTNTIAAGVRFYAKWAIENNYDFCQFQVSNDGGTSWSGQCGLYTNPGVDNPGGVQAENEPVYDGTQSSWISEVINLSDYIGEIINVRFFFRSDNGLTMDGFYFDDFEVLYTMDPNLGLDEQLLQSVKAMPNPANTSATIAFEKPIAKGTIAVYGLTGQLVYSETIHALTTKATLDIQSWSEGIYTIIVSGTEATYSPTKLAIVH